MRIRSQSRDSREMFFGLISEFISNTAHEYCRRRLYQLCLGVLTWEQRDGMLKCDNPTIIRDLADI
jgi:hypothetical protein